MQRNPWRLRRTASRSPSGSSWPAWRASDWDSSSGSSPRAPRAPLTALSCRVVPRSRPPAGISRAVRNTVETTALAKSGRAPTGWSAGAVRFGDGRAGRDGSRRVKEVQRRLRPWATAPGRSTASSASGPRTRSAGSSTSTSCRSRDRGPGHAAPHPRSAGRGPRPSRQPQGAHECRRVTRPRRWRRGAADAPAPDTAATAAVRVRGPLMVAVGADRRRRTRARRAHRHRSFTAAASGPSPTPRRSMSCGCTARAPTPPSAPSRGIVKPSPSPTSPAPAGWVADSQYLIQDPAKPSRSGPRRADRRARSRPPADGHARTPTSAPVPSATSPRPQGTDAVAAGRRGSRRPARSATGASLQIAEDAPGEPDAAPDSSTPSTASPAARRHASLIASLAHMANPWPTCAPDRPRRRVTATLVVCDIDLDTSTTVGRRTANALAGLEPRAEQHRPGAPVTAPAPATTDEGPARPHHTIPTHPDYAETHAGPSPGPRPLPRAPRARALQLAVNAIDDAVARLLEARADQAYLDAHAIATEHDLDAVHSQLTGSALRARAIPVRARSTAAGRVRVRASPGTRASAPNRRSMSRPVVKRCGASRRTEPRTPA